MLETFASYRTTYTFNSPKHGQLTVQAVVVKKYSKGRYKRKGAHWFAYAGSGLPPSIEPHQVFEMYHQRFGIKQSFRDDKYGGFDMEHTRLQQAERSDHLLLAIAIDTLWCHELGAFVLKRGDDSRCQVDPAYICTLSLFQLGLRWLKRALATGIHFLPSFRAILSNLRLKPVAIPVTQNSIV